MRYFGIDFFSERPPSDPFSTTPQPDLPARMMINDVLVETTTEEESTNAGVSFAPIIVPPCVHPPTTLEPVHPTLPQ
jgi:hypothetical protein